VIQHEITHILLRPQETTVNAQHCDAIIHLTARQVYNSGSGSGSIGMRSLEAGLTLLQRIEGVPGLFVAQRVASKQPPIPRLLTPTAKPIAPELLNVESVCCKAALVRRCSRCSRCSRALVGFIVIHDGICCGIAVAFGH
jgi:hypothetical protein